MRDGCFSVYGICHPLHDRARATGNGNRDGAFWTFGQITAYSGQVGAVDLSFFYHIRKNTAAQCILSHDQKPCRVPV